MNISKLVTLIIGAFMLLLSPAAFALKCVDANGGGTSITQQIPSNIPVPADAADGTIIWESPQYNISATCSQDRPDTTDTVYLYVNPDNSPPAIGVRVGIRLNGTVYYNTSGQINLNQTVNNSTPSVTFPLSFSVVLKKSGATPASGVTNFNRYSVFQMDGSGGLNNIPNSNLNFYLNGKIIFIGCNATLTFSPSSTVDFGSLPATGVTGTVAATRPLTLMATRTCATGYKLGVYFNATSPTGLSNSQTWNLGNGLGVQFIDDVTGTAVPLNGTISNFVDLSSLSTGSHAYTVQLLRLNGNGRVGSYSGTMTIMLDYQ